ncbi:MAG TPA: alcohol dehydrogenase [Methylomirabilota bacterium]|nr:alcohol dehydrogenase [Methylomirabilota bacterium]
MGATYKAIEVSAPGTFRAVEKSLPTPAPGQVRIRVEACGVCHSDSATVEGQWPGLSFPRVPGHEAVGRIEEIGAGVSTWKVGQRVGVGFFGGEDGTCESCRRGETAYCQNPIMTGITSDGGYAEVMIAEARALALIPEELKSEEAAPLLCAGITTFNALRNTGRAGDTVAIQGIGGLGHLGVQFARRMGFRTVAIGGGPDKQHLAVRLGAHVYIDAKAENAAAALQKLGGADVILATAPSGSAIGSLLPGLAVRGKLVAVGVSNDAIPLNGVPLIFGGRSVVGSLTGRAIEIQDTLDFCVLTEVRPMIETLPLPKAEEAYKRMMEGKARFRMVLTMT